MGRVRGEFQLTATCAFDGGGGVATDEESAHEHQRKQRGHHNGLGDDQCGQRLRRAAEADGTNQPATRDAHAGDQDVAPGDARLLGRCRSGCRGGERRRTGGRLDHDTGREHIPDEDGIIEIGLLEGGSARLACELGEFSGQTSRRRCSQGVGDEGVDNSAQHEHQRRHGHRGDRRGAQRVTVHARVRGHRSTSR